MNEWLTTCGHEPSSWISILAIARRRATAGKMSHHTSACLFEIDELVAEMYAVRRQSREERLLQISAVKANARHVGEICGESPDGVASRIVRRGRFNDRASVHDLLHQAQTLQHANRVCRKSDARADFLQLRGALKNFDAKTCLPQSNRSSESADTRADDENFRLCLVKTSHGFTASLGFASAAAISSNDGARRI